jgi:hypothetical protein
MGLGFEKRLDSNISGVDCLIYLKEDDKVYIFVFKKGSNVMFDVVTEVKGKYKDVHYFSFENLKNDRTIRQMDRLAKGKKLGWDK